MHRLAPVRDVLHDHAAGGDAAACSPASSWRFAYAFIGVIAGEFILSGGGLGYAIAYAYESFENARCMALMLLVLLMAIGVNGVLYAWETRLERGGARGMTRCGRMDALLVLAACCWLIWQGAVPICRRRRDHAAAARPSSLRRSCWRARRSGRMSARRMLAFCYALAISAVLGVLLGLVLGLRRFAGDVAEPILAALYTIPKVTLYPVMLLMFGLGLSAKVAFGVIHGMVPIVLFTLAAVKNLPPVCLRAARALRLRRVQTATRDRAAPAVMPEIVSGLRVGFALTLLGVLIGEMFASQRGLGFLIINGINSHNVPMTTSVTLIIVVFAIAANSALLALDRRMHHAPGAASQGTARS